MHVARHVVDARARVFARDAKAGTVAIVTPAVRQADNSGAHRRRSLRQARRPRLRPTRAARIAVGQMARRGVHGVDKQGTARRAFHQTPGIVHPGVVVAKLASSDQQELAGRLAVGFREELRARLAEQVTGRHIGHAIRRGDPIPKAPWLERSEIDTVRKPAQLRQRQPVRPDAEKRVDEPLRPQPPGAKQCEPAEGTRDEDPTSELGHDLPVEPLRLPFVG